ncbi:MAG: carboxypeptidase regulatory-like domain-containing protein [Acidobacteriota bacterium]
MNPSTHRIVLWRSLWSGALVAVFTWSIAFALPSSAAEITVSGMVSSAGGEPLAEVAIGLQPVVDPHRRALEVRRGRMRGEAVVSGRSQADGTFRLEVPRGGLWRVVLEHPGWISMRTAPLPLVDDRLLPPVALVREQGTEVTVVDESGRPVAGAHVRALGLDEAQRLQRGELWQFLPRTAVTDDTGRARLARAAEERLGLWAVAPGFWQRTGEVAGPAARLVLPKGVERRVEVRDAAGRPVSGVVVGVGETAWPLAVTGDDGRAAFAGPRRGRTPLTLIHPAGWRVPDVLPPVAPASSGLVTRQLPPVSRFQGTVSRRDGRERLANALVWSVALPALAVRTNARGEFAFPPLPVGAPFFRATAAGSLARTVRTTLEAGIPARQAIVLQPATRIAGRVTGRQEALAGALVELEPRAAGAAALRWRTASDGRFSLPGLDPAAGYRLTVSKDGYGSEQLAFEPLQHRADRTALSVVLAAEQMAVGQVVDGRGRGIAGARVGWSDRRRRQAAPVASDREGRFELRDLTAGPITLQVEAAGFAPALLRGVELRAGNGPIALGTIALEPEAVLGGRVEDGRGRPVAGARVEAARRSLEGLALPVARSNEQGRFRLVGLAPGERLELAVEAPGYARRAGDTVDVPLDAELVLVVDAAAVLRGFVTNDGGELVEGAEVWARLGEAGSLAVRSDAAAAEDVRIGPVRSDREGRFELAGVPGGLVSLGAYARGYLRLDVSAFEVDPEAPPGELELVLERGALVRGKVSSAAGAAVAGARVFVDRGVGRVRGEQTGVVSDGDGRFELPGVPSGPVRVAAKHDRLGVTTAGLEVSAGEHSLDLVFEGRGAIRGRVINAAGVGVAGVEVVADSGEQRFRGRSDAQGTYHLPTVEDGEYLLTARTAGLAPAELEEPLVVAGSEVLAPDLEVGSGGAIIGNLVGLTDQDWPRVQVLARGPGTGAGQAGEVAYGGSYRIAPLAAGSYTVTAQLPGSGRQARGRIEIEAGAEEAVLDLEFDVGLRLAGRVLDAGQGLAGASLVLVGLDRPARASSESRSGGDFEISGIDPGLYRLEVAAPRGGAQTAKLVAMTADKRLEVDLGSGSLAGEVLASGSGESLADVALRFQPLDLELEPGWQGPAGSTDSDGRFVLQGVAAGRYRLEALKFGYQTVTVEVEVRAGEFTDGLRLELPRSGG